MSEKAKKKSLLLPWKEAAHINIKAMKLLWGEYPQMFASRIIYIIYNALTPYVGIYLSALILGELSTTRDPQRLMRLVIITLASAAVISLIAALIRKWYMTNSAGMYYKVDRILTKKLLDMDFACVEDAKTQQLLSTIIQNQNGQGWGLINAYSGVEQIVSSATTILGGAALTVTLFTSRVPQSAGWLTVLNNPFIVLLVLAVMILITYASPALSSKANEYWARETDKHNLANRLFGFYGWMGYHKDLAADIRIYRQDIICDKYNTDKHGTFASKGPFAKSAKGPIGLYTAAGSAVSVVFTGFVYAFVCLKAIAGAFGVGEVTQYVSAVTMLAGGASKIFGNLNTARMNASFLKPVFEFLEMPSDMSTGTVPISESDIKNFEIEFKNVSFKYPGSEDYVLKNVSLKLNSGSCTAIVGQNGSGKTTFIKLLCRLYDPTEGVITLNGRDIREYDYAQYMRVFSVVFQDFKLFDFMLAQNVASGSGYDGGLVEECLEKSGFGERLKSLPQGIETYLHKGFSKEGVDVSGGEAQKIALARTLYRNAPFIVLDEPTAALDPIAESEMYAHFNSIVGGKTAVYISHRLSSCRFCQDILVFDCGRLVQRGEHEELLADESGKYYELWTAQSQYYA